MDADVEAHAVKLVCADHPGLGPAPHMEYEWARDYVCSGRTTTLCTECGQLGADMGTRCHVGGVDIGDWRKVSALAEEMGISPWDATMRPGAWEYHRGRGELLRRKLAAMGYVEENDVPDRPLGSRWARVSNEDEKEVVVRG